MDRDLVEAARKRDRGAYADLIRTRGDRVFALAHRILRDVDRAEDAVQDALVIAWRDLPGLRDPDRFDAWLHRLVVRSRRSRSRYIVADATTFRMEDLRMATDAQAWEEQLIADLRANGGTPSQGPLAGHPIMVLYTTGAKSGERRRSVVTYSKDGDAYVIAGTNGGNRTKHPSWLANIHANPHVTFDIGTQTFIASAEEATGPERDRLWARHVEQNPWFGKYPEQITERVIPVVRIAPKG